MQVVNSIEMLNDLRRRWAVMASVRNTPEYVLDLQELTGQENEALSRQINQLKNVCGCLVAWLCLMVSCLLLAGHYLFSESRSPELNIQILIFYPAIMLSATLVGKALTVAWARLRLLWLADRIIRQWQYPVVQ